MVSRRSLRVIAWFVLASGPGDDLCAEDLQHDVSHVLVESKEKAYEVRKDILGGRDLDAAFAAAAKKHSLDRRSAKAGGKVGWVGMNGSYDDAFARGALRTRVGKVSGPIGSGFGWHLIYVQAERGSGDRPKPGKRVRDVGAKRRASSTRAVAVIDRSLARSGGREAYEAVKDRTLRFTNHKEGVAAEQATAAIALHMTDGGKIREEWTIEGFQVQGKNLEFAQVHDGKTGWVVMLGRVSTLQGRTLTVFLANKRFMPFFVTWRADGYALRYIGEKSVGIGEEKRKVVTEVVDGYGFTGSDNVRLFFSKETGMLVKKEWIDISQAPAKKAEEHYEKYEAASFGDKSGREVLVPRQVTIFLDGKLDTTRTISEATFNNALADEFFGKPAVKPFHP